MESPIAVPDEARTQYPHARVIDFGPPRGFTEEQVGRAEAIIIDNLEGQTFGHQVSAPVKLTDAEIEALRAGQPLWLNLGLPRLVPFNISVGPVPPVI